MFDIGFWEIFVILIVALIVVGPERLPTLARKAGLWIGKIRGFVTSVKGDIDREFAAEELKKVIGDQESKGPGLHEIIEETKQAVAEVDRTIKEAESDYMLGAMSNDEVENRQSEILQKLTDDSKPAEITEQKQAKESEVAETAENKQSDPPPVSETTSSDTEPAAKDKEKVTDHDSKA
jgi:sec-independent protein translocase protein TatB